MKSLRNRLLVFVALAIVATALLEAGLAWRAARAEADALFDYQMQQTAMTLGASLPDGLAQGVLPWVETTQQVDFVIQIWSLDGALLLRSADRPELPLRAVMGYEDVKAHQTTYRVFATLTGGVVIQVAQDMRVRNRMAGDLALRAAAPILWISPVLMLALLAMVRWSFKPVSRIREQLARRGAQDWNPVAEEGLPDEIKPLVQEFNALLGRLAQSFEAQQRFVADAAHELRSPLAALKLQVEALRRSNDEETRLLALQRLGQGVDRSQRLIQQLLDLARQQARLSTQASPLARIDDLALWLQPYLNDCLPTAHARGQDLGLRGPAGARVAVWADSDALGVLVRNLLENALKYTPAGGRIDVVIEPPNETGATVGLMVEDSGPGIPVADRERVLDRFYRQPDAPSGGSGLGLSIAQSVAQLHHTMLLLDRSNVLGGLRIGVMLRSAA